MNTMKILVGATFTLLIVALFLAYDTMKKDASSEPSAVAKRVNALESEIARLKHTIAQYDNFKKNPSPTGTSSANPYASGNSIIDDQQRKRDADQLAAHEEKIARIKDQYRLELEQKDQEIAEVKKEAEIASQESDAIVESSRLKKNANDRRAESISKASLMGTIFSYANDQTAGEIVEIQLLHPQSISIGQELGIRRGKGISARVEVSVISENMAFADVLPNPSSIVGTDIAPITKGDEVIVIPLF